MAPLEYYINTGRAPTEFLRLLINLNERQINVVANRLIKYSGNADRAINEICVYIGFTRNKY